MFAQSVRVGSSRKLFLESLESRRLLDAGTLDLVRFESAEELEATLLTEALAKWEPYFGQETWQWRWQKDDVFFGCPDCEVALGAPEQRVPDHSDTNTQVAGVDEADIVETDGNYLYMISGRELIIADAWVPQDLRIVSRMQIDGQPIGQFLSGNQLTVVSTDYVDGGFPRFWGGPAIDARIGFLGPYGEPKTILTVVDVSDQTQPEIVQTTEIDGNYTSSRAIGGKVYLVTTSDYGLPAPEILCEVADVQTCAYESREAYVSRVDGRILDLSLPHYSTYDNEAVELTGGLLSDATDVFKPIIQHAPNLISVSVFDSSATTDVRSVSVPSTYSTSVYGSSGSLYLTNPDWGSGWGNAEATSIFKFDFTENGSGIDLAAAGQVPGRLLNQFSMNEYVDAIGELYFHIATTAGWGPASDNRVFVLRQNGETLETVGQTPSLARGEQIFSVRYSGATAYVVTFVQTDPLFTIDLSNPANPEVLGELHITGFSNYMQSVGDGFVIGLGRNADPRTGRAQELQINLFDVSNLSNPKLADRYTFKMPDWAWSEGLSDHHAIGYYPDQQVLTIPVSNGGGWVGFDRNGDGLDDVMMYRPKTELYVFQLTLPKESNDAAAIRLLGTLKHDADVRRSVRIEDYLYTISAQSISIHEIQNPSAEVNSIHFGRQDVGISVYEVNVLDPIVDRAIHHPETTPPQVLEVRAGSTDWDYGLLNYLEFGMDAESSPSIGVLSFATANQIKVRFSEDVWVGTQDLRISRSGGPPISFQDFTYDMDTHTAIWTLAEPLSAGKTSIRLSGIRDMENQRLDGSFNGRAGGTFRYEFNVLPGDVDGDGRVDRADLASAMARADAKAGDIRYSLAHDVDGNGRINKADFDLIQNFTGTTLPGYRPPVAGDSNDDGIFDSKDLVHVMQRGLYRTAQYATYAQGDWNRDGVFDETDLVFAFQQGTYVIGNAAAVDAAFANERFDSSKQ